MASIQYVVILLLITFKSLSLSQSRLQISPETDHSLPFNPISINREIPKADASYCDSWRLSVETNNAGAWVQIPERCVDFVEEYMTGDKYSSDIEVASEFASEYAKTINVAGGGKDAWVFDIDETLLSNVPYYQVHGFGSEIFDENSFNEWVDLAEAPALQTSLRFYKELQQLGFKVFLLTGRSEFQRNATEKNLLHVGYRNWERLFLRGPDDMGKKASVYKSEKRKELEDEGYTIHGSSGDQWSDLLGFAVAKRSLKLPNPMYYIA
ncbi:unnamed protein product [Ilex paraguariensis]|uniref:Acid phosphatase 1 n=1 Tax=Ilex paraguariensis TaxID=185542 RepID=A0ABC8RMD3_9AQUA